MPFSSTLEDDRERNLNLALSSENAHCTLGPRTRNPCPHLTIKPAKRHQRLILPKSWHLYSNAQVHALVRICIVIQDDHEAAGFAVGRELDRVEVKVGAGRGRR